MIYFIQAGDSGAIKIGTCRDDQIKARLGALQIGNPDEFRVLGIMDGNEAYERALHSRFRNHRQRGEWFAPVTEIIDHIRTHGKEFQLKRRRHPETPVEHFINKLGGATKAAAALGISNPSVVLNWRMRRQVPADKVLAIEQVSGISRHVLRPDIFGVSA